MRKMRKITSIIAGLVLALVPVLATPITSMAEELEPEGCYWYTWDYEQEDDISTGIPIQVTVNTSIAGFEWDAEGMFTDCDDVIAQMTEEDKQEYADLVNRMSGKLFAEAYVWGEGPDEEGFNKGDSFTLMLPFSGDLIESRIIENGDKWEITGYTSNSITCTCLEDDTWVCGLAVMYQKKSNSADMFWFQPMRTQLAIAAETALANGSGVAEVSGDFGLSYDIMAWLDAHPGVTLKYILTYKEKEYVLTIPGGGKLANPEIPWYGPEYLIGKFCK